MFILHLDYDELDPATYRGFVLNIPGHKTRFNSGDPVADYLAVAIYLATLGNPYVTGSSSCDHFVMDGGVRYDDPKLHTKAAWNRARDVPALQESP